MELEGICPVDRGFEKSLDGKWRFKLEQGATIEKRTHGLWDKYPIQTPETFEPFYVVDYEEDDAWHDLNVPGNWEIEGYSPATYGPPDNASGFYRLKFAVPEEWRGGW